MKQIICIIISLVTIMSALLMMYNIIGNNTSEITFLMVCSLILVSTLILSILVVKSLKKTNYKDFISLENVPIEFENIYATLYNTHIYDLEKMRKKVRIRTIVEYIFLALFLIGYALGDSDVTIISSEVDAALSLVGLLSFLIFGACLLINSKHKTKYRKTYKNEIVPNFIKLVNNQLNYKPFDAETLDFEHDYTEANFDGRKFNRFYPDDYIEGPLDDETYVKMSEIHVQNVTGSGKSKRTEELFHGIFAFTKCQDIGTYIKISKNKHKFLAKDNIVEMDSEEFEKYFDVYSEDKILAMRFLTSDIMELLVDFYNKYYLDFEIVFRNDIIYLRFFTGAMFEPKIFGNSMDKKLLFTYYCILEFIVEITKKANAISQEVEI